MDIKEIENNIRGLLVALGEDSYREGLGETPTRVALMYYKKIDVAYVSSGIKNVY